MSTLASHVEAESSATRSPQRHRGPGLPCSCAAALPVLREKDPELADEVDAWLAGELAGYSAPDVFKAMRGVGAPASLSALQRHRRQICRCFS